MADELIGDLASEDILNDAISAYDSTGGSSAANPGPVTVNLDAEHFTSSANYSLASDEITVTAAGRYLIAWAVSYDVPSSSSRSQLQTWLEVDTVEVAGTRASMYMRMTNYGGTGHAQIYYDLSASDVVRIRAQRTVGSASCDGIPDGSRLLIRRVY